MGNQVICSRCVLDNTVNDIWYDENGECKYCKIHDEMEKAHPLDMEMRNVLEKLIKRIKKHGKNKKYDCIVGVSGGRDSTYTLLTAVKLGLRPLAVHFDNGWNSDISVLNIKNACKKLNVDLHTVVADWEEFKDLQISFLKASTPDADIPSDYAIYSVLFDVANQEGIKYVLNGHSFRTEGTSPISWTYMDGKYLKNVHKKFGKIKRIKSFPIMSMARLVYFVFIKRIKEIRLMEFIAYNKDKVDEILKHEVGWKYYGGHHHENVYTKFFQSYYLPIKFNIDKRKIELSALIRSGQITRGKALKIIETTSYEYDKYVVEYTISKLGLRKEVFNNIMASPCKSHKNYKTYLPIIRFLKYPIRVAASMRLIPYILYLKYAN